MDLLSDTAILPYLIFGGFLWAALFCGIQLIRLEALRIKRRPGRYADLCFWMLAASIVGGRTAQVLANEPLAPLQFFYLWNGGCFYLGGLPAAVAAGLVYLYKFRIPIWTTADVFAPALAAGYFFVRSGCFYSGLCRPFPLQAPALETLSGNPLGFDLLELFLASGGLLGFFALLKLRRLKRFEGQVFWTAVLFGGLLHSTAEGLYDGLPQLHPALLQHGEPLVPLLIFLGAAGMLVRLGSRTEGSTIEPDRG